MEAKDIFFLLIQIEEAHTPAWPTGTIILGTPHADFADRCASATAFSITEVPTDSPFQVLVDPWHKSFANRYHAWPDQYVLLDSKRTIVQKSTYNAHREATLDVDCVDLILSL
jgi:hypothetical protein